MPTKSPLDQDVYPPFDGFPKSGIGFLKKLKKNNNREWFHTHRAEYEEAVKFPMQCLIGTLAEKMRVVAPDFDFNPKNSIFRIHRDVRFSKNKAPYKTNIAAAFDMRGKKSPVETPGLYVGIEPGSIFIGGGLYMPMGDQLKAIRRSIVEKPHEFLAVINERRFKNRFGGIKGESLVKAPLGFPKDHPMVEHLRHKQFFVGVEWTDESQCYSKKFADTVAGVFSDCMPLVRWLIEAID